MKTFRKVLLYILILFILLLGTLYFFILTHQNEIEETVIKQLDKHLLTELKIKDISVSLFAKFPKVSVIITGVELKESINNSKENLAEIESIYFVMNLIGVLQKNYQIERLYINGGKIDIKINEKNENNYTIWKSPTDTVKKKQSFQFNLKRIQLSNIEFTYSNLHDKLAIIADISKLHCQGQFSNENYEFEAEIKALIRNLEIDNKSYLNSTKFDIETQIFANNSTDEYNIKYANFQVDDISVITSGKVKVNEQNNGLDLDLNISGEGINITELEIYIPENVISKYYPWERSGKLTVNGEIQGIFSKTSNPEINLNFELSKGYIKHRSNKLGITEIEASGVYSNGTNKNLKFSFIRITGFEARLANNHMKGKASITNFDDPVLNLEYSSDIDFSNLNDFYTLRDIYKIGGNARITLNYKGKINDLNKQLNSKTIILNGDIQFDNVDIQLDSNSIEYNDFSGEITFTENDLKIKKLSGRYLNSKFDVTGIATNYLFFNTDNKLSIKANVKSDYIDLYELIMSDSTTSDEGNNHYALVIPSNLKMEIFLDCKEIDYQKFKARKLFGMIIVDSSKIFMNNISFFATGGKMQLNGQLELSDSNLINIYGNAQLTKINISHLFYQFSDFDQDYLTYKQLKGSLNSKIHINSFWNHDWSADLDKLSVIADLVIDEAELIHFEPLENLIKFAKMKKMQHILFDQIENTILIKDREVIIPQMTFKNSAFTMSMSGVHSFEDDIDYKFKINLTEMFFGRHKQSKDDFEGENDESGGINLYIHMTGKADDPKYKFDKRALKNKLLDDINKEKKELRDLFKTNKLNITKKEEEFEFIWDDE